MEPGQAEVLPEQKSKSPSLSPPFSAADDDFELPEHMVCGQILEKPH